MSDRSQDDEDLAEVAEELAGELRRLREELDEEQRGPPRGPLGIPRPPSPGEFLEFADEVAIPGLIAILEANIKLLEALQRAIRLADTERRARERSAEVGSEAADRASDVSRRALDRLQDGMEDLRAAIEGGAVPDDEVGSDLLTDIQRLQEEIERRIDESRSHRERTGRRADETARSPDGSDNNVGSDTNGESNDDGVRVDVDAELDSLKEQYSEDPDDEDDDKD